LINLDEKNILLAIFAAILQYFQTKMTFALNKTHGEPQKAIAANQKIMMYIGPVITLVVLFNLPAAIGLYWTVSNIFSIIQQIFINKKINSKELAEPAN
jgi:YidC/Oxa1 family membrane protein insertase